MPVCFTLNEFCLLNFFKTIVFLCVCVKSFQDCNVTKMWTTEPSWRSDHTKYRYKHFQDDLLRPSSEVVWDAFIHFCLLVSMQTVLGYF